MQTQRHQLPEKRTWTTGRDFYSSTWDSYTCTCHALTNWLLAYLITIANLIFPVETSTSVMEMIQADFGNASPSNIIELEAVMTILNAIVEVSYPPDAQVFVSDMQGDVWPEGATCWPVPLGSSKVEDSSKFIKIPLNGIDTVIYICQNGVIVGRCIHVYSSSLISTWGQSEMTTFHNDGHLTPFMFDLPTSSSTYFQWYITFSFAGAAIDNFISFDFNIPSGRGVAGISGCTGCCLYFLSGAGISGDSSGGGIGCFGHGDSCPPEGAELIPSNSDFTLFSIEDDTGIYACQNGIVVGQCVIIEGTTQLLVAHLKVHLKVGGHLLTCKSASTD